MEVRDDFLSRLAGLTGVESLQGDEQLQQQCRSLCSSNHNSDDNRPLAERLLQIEGLRIAGVPRLLSRLQQALGDNNNISSSDHNELHYTRGPVQPRLAAGGGLFFLAHTPAADVQIGVPAECIKEFVREGRSPPSVLVLPPESVDSPSSSTKEVEFPLFWSFFMGGGARDREQRVVVVGSRQQLARVEAVFSESMFGPPDDQLYMDDDCAPGAPRPDFPREKAALAASASDVNDFALFLPFDEHGSCVLPRGLEVRIRHSILLEIWDTRTAQCLAVVDLTSFLEQRVSESLSYVLRKELASVPDYYAPPSLGVTFIGTSHGFDGHGRTTGFIVWIGGRGIVVDPPVETPAFLQVNRIDPMLIQDAILTHVHADHRSGLAPLIFSHPTKLRVHTFKSIHMAYLRTLRADMNRDDVASLYEFKHVRAGEPFLIMGARWIFDFAFHTLPTLRFVVSYGNRTISYAADTFYDPDKLHELARQGVFSRERLQSLLYFPFSADLIIHESGVPPIHTPLSTLASLPDHIRRKIVVVHCSDLPKTYRGDLRIPSTGMHETLVIPLSELNEGMSLASRLQLITAETYLFRKMPAFALEKLSMTREVVYFPPDAHIVSIDDECPYFYLIVDGLAFIKAHDVTKIDDEGADARVTQGIVMGAPGFPGTWPSVMGTAAVVSRIVPFSQGRGAAGDQYPEDASNVMRVGDCVGLWHLLGQTPQAAIVTRTAVVAMRWRWKNVHDALASGGAECLEWAQTCARAAQRHVRFLCKWLPQSDIFRQLPAPVVQLVATAFDPRVSRFAAGQLIFAVGASSRGFHVVRRGSVGVRDSRGVLLATYTKGHCFGELSVVRDYRSASAHASEDTELLNLSVHNLGLLMEAFPVLRLALERQIAVVIERSSSRAK